MLAGPFPKRQTHAAKKDQDEEGSGDGAHRTGPIREWGEDS
jgi:hypothetical protein